MKYSLLLLSIITSLGYAYETNYASLYYVVNQQSIPLGGAKFQVESYAIGNAADWGGVGLAYPGSNEILVSANRNGSWNPWLFLMQAENITGAEAPYFSEWRLLATHLPVEPTLYLVNFAFIGTLNWTAPDGHTQEVCPNVTIFQMSNIIGYVGNAWFIGSNNGGQGGHSWYSQTNGDTYTATAVTCTNTTSQQNTTYFLTITGTEG
jgi:hypothetical protein